MVEPDPDRLASELAARGTDASPLEAVLDPLPEEGTRPAPPGQGDFGRDPAGEFDALTDPAVSAGPPEEDAGLQAPSAASDTLYEVLGVSPQASREQIEKAYRFCLDMYKEGALATYSLVEAGDAEAVRRRISFAHETLLDSARRREYDLGLGLIPSEAAASPYLAGEPAAASAPSTGEAPLPGGPLTGAELRRIRESRGVSLREISVSSKIGLRFLEYIEADRFASLPPSVYLRGFLQEYARALGLDARRAADAYMSRMGRG
jgi:hypothetical protein